MKPSLRFAPIIAMVAFGAVMHAETFTFTLSSNGNSGTGTLSGSVDPYNSSAFDITSGSGSYGSSTISLVNPSGNSHTAIYDPAGAGGPTTRPTGPYFGYDNVLYTSGIAVDYAGLLFNISGSSDVLNLYSQSGAFVTQMAVPGTVPAAASAATFSFVDTTAATPEPSSLVLLGTGAVGLLGAVRRRFV